MQRSVRIKVGVVLVVLAGGLLGLASWYSERLPAVLGGPTRAAAHISQESLTTARVQADIERAVKTAFHSQDGFDLAIESLRKQVPYAIDEIRKRYYAESPDSSMARWLFTYIAEEIGTHDAMEFLAGIVWEKNGEDIQAEESSLYRLSALQGASTICWRLGCDVGKMLRDVVSWHADNGMRRSAAGLYLTYAPDLGRAREELLKLVPPGKESLIPKKVIPLESFTPEMLAKEREEASAQQAR